MPPVKNTLTDNGFCFPDMLISWSQCFINNVPFAVCNDSDISYFILFHFFSNAIHNPLNEVLNSLMDYVSLMEIWKNTALETVFIHLLFKVGFTEL